VEHERCTECGFDGATYDDRGLLDAWRALGAHWRALLATAGEHLRTRPAPGVWSAIEYAAHSRDITAIHVAGVEIALPGDEPVLPPFPDNAVDEMASGYGREDPDAVLDALERHATRLAELADEAGVDAWRHGLTIGTERNDVRRLLEHGLHDSTHHLRDVELGLGRLRGGRS
jgi:hypothetical protein